MKNEPVSSVASILSGTRCLADVSDENVFNIEYCAKPVVAIVVNIEETRRWLA